MDMDRRSFLTGGLACAGLAVSPGKHPVADLISADDLAAIFGESALSIGAYEPVDVSESILAYERRYNDQRLLVVLNLSADTVHPRCWPTSGELLQSTSMQPADRSGGHLAPDEGCVFRLRD
jgi:hypothetical protein